MHVVCTNCGWNRDIRKDQVRGNKMYCPGCGSFLSLYESHRKETNWALWITVGIGAFFLLFGILACVGMIVVRLAMDNMR